MKGRVPGKAARGQRGCSGELLFRIDCNRRAVQRIIDAEIAAEELANPVFAVTEVVVEDKFKGGGLRGGDGSHPPQFELQAAG